MNFVQKLLLWILRISPVIIEAVRPMLQAQAVSLWREGMPIARDIVEDLWDNAEIDGEEKHWVAVNLLREELKMKLRKDFQTLDLSEVVLKAYRALLIEKEK
jgi:hypothetical protein